MITGLRFLGYLLFNIFWNVLFIYILNNVNIIQLQSIDTHTLLGCLIFVMVLIAGMIVMVVPFIPFIICLLFELRLRNVI